MSDRDLGSMRRRVWQLLCHGVADPNAPARFVTLATVGTNGGAEARMLALRGADEKSARIKLYTDARTEKVTEIRANAGGTALVWDAALKFQVRLRLTLSITVDSAVEWIELSETQLGNYGVTPAPGTPIARSDDFVRRPDSANFCILDCKVEEFEALDLLSDPHRRAVFQRLDGFSGQWIAP